MVPATSRTLRTSVPVLLLAAGLAVMVVSLVASSHLPSLDLAKRASTAAMFGSFAIYALVLVAIHRSGATVRPRHVWVGALVFRLTLLGSQPVLSDDIWRYLWDGHLQLNGVNPYLYAPSSTVLSGLHTATWPLINYPDIPTIYPPASQAVFAIAAAVSSTSVAMRAAMVLAELAFAPAVIKLVEARRGPLGEAARGALLVAVLWNPLTMVEFASSGHLDSLAVAPLLWALAFVVPRCDGRTVSAPRRVAPWFVAGALISLSVGAKLLGGLALFPLAMWALWPGGVTSAAWSNLSASSASRLAALLGGAALTLTLTFAPYFTSLGFDEGGDFSTAMATYARKWQWNDGLYRVAKSVERSALGAKGASGDPPLWRFDSLGGLFTRIGMVHEDHGEVVASTTFDLGETSASVVKLLAALLLGLVLLALLHQHLEPLTVVTVIIASTLLISPVVHPWYVAWLVPLGIASGSWALVVWSGLVVLSYLPGFEDSTGLRLLEYLPVFVLLGVELWKRLVRQSPLNVGILTEETR